MLPIIEMKNIHRDFNVGGEIVRALNGITFSINPGEFVAIMGASGSGKSTLLNILGCLDTPSTGSYILDQSEVRKMGKNERARLRNRKIGFVFQLYNLLPRTTALENVELPLLYSKDVSSKERRERALEALKAVGLENRLKHMPNQLSGGQQQRVAIARALVNDPVIILADEATGNLDTRTSYEIMALFQELNTNGKTIVFVTHENDIATLTGRRIVLRDGKVIRDEISENINARELIKNIPVIQEEND